MNQVTGHVPTLEDLRGLAYQLYTIYGTGKEHRALSAIVGEESLSATDRIYLKIAERFENEFVNQRPDEDRTIDQSLTIAWDILADLPDTELKRLKPEMIQKYKPQRGAVPS
jgi:V/A-type H+-transporting ATPase subunit B